MTWPEATNAAATGGRSSLAGTGASTIMSDEAEVRGLLALMLHCEARRTARRGPKGQYVPLSEQDPKQWSLELIEEAERHLADAANMDAPAVSA